LGLFVDWRRPARVIVVEQAALTMQRRTLANAVQVGLARLKRDLKNLGMTESQAHEIIPDSPVGTTATAPPQPLPQAAANVPPAAATKPEQLS
jgi:hypothetical protein